MIEQDLRLTVYQLLALLGIHLKGRCAPSGIAEIVAHIAHVVEPIEILTALQLPDKVCGSGLLDRQTADMLGNKSVGKALAVDREIMQFVACGECAACDLHVSQTCRTDA